jgi:hypothetical protein
MPANAPISARKLREAEFFFQHLERATHDTTTEATEARRFYLSAFLSAAISVVQILSDKKRHCKLYKKWVETLQPMDRDLICFLKGERNAEVHRRGARVKPVKVRRPRSLYPNVQVLRFTDLMGAEIEYGPKGEWIVVTREGIEQWFTISGQQRPVVEVCRDCVSLLRNLLTFIEDAE